MAKKKSSGQSAQGYSNGGSGGAGVAATDGSKTDVTDAKKETWKSVPSLLQRRGGEANAKVALQEVDKERKLVAVGDMEKGETVFKIPRHLWFTAACLTSHEVGRAALKWAKSHANVPFSAFCTFRGVELCMLALLLLLERQAEAQSRWADYIAALPWSAALPLTWPEEVSKLGGASPHWYIQERQRQLEKVHASLVSYMKGAVLAELKAACPSSEEFILAFAKGLAHSRAMGIPSVDGDGRRWHLAMLPFADMLNHSCVPEALPSGKDISSYVEAHTLCNVAAGSELRISYKRAGSAQGFFATYGFIEEAQEVCCTELRLEPWDGPGNGSIVCLSSTQSLRRLLSHFRAEAASPEERVNLDLEAAESCAHFPLPQTQPRYQGIKASGHCVIADAATVKHSMQPQNSLRPLSRQLLCPRWMPAKPARLGIRAFLFGPGHVSHVEQTPAALQEFLVVCSSCAFSVPQLSWLCPGVTRVELGLPCMRAWTRWSWPFGHGYRCALGHGQHAVSAAFWKSERPGSHPGHLSKRLGALRGHLRTQQSSPEGACFALAATASGLALASYPRLLGWPWHLIYPGLYPLHAMEQSDSAETAMERVASTRVELWRSQRGLQDEQDFAFAFSSYGSAVAHGGHHVATAWLSARSPTHRQRALAHR
eukprot:s242_g36.t1